jgi:hypothetical protein
MKQNNTIRTATSGRKGQQSNVQFLNLTNPNDATSSDALAVIRSHVAKNTHGRKQQSRRARLEIRQYCPIQSSKTSDRPPQGALQPEAKEPGRARGVRQRQNREGARMIELNTWIPNPQTSVTSTRKNPFQTSARIISDSEDALVDHCKAPALHRCQAIFFLFSQGVAAGALIVRRYHLRGGPWLYRVYSFRGRASPSSEGPITVCTMVTDRTRPASWALYGGLSKSVDLASRKRLIQGLAVEV